MKEILNNAEKYGFKIPDKDKYQPYKYKLIKFDEAIPNLADWAKIHGTTYKDVKILNPWIIKRKLPAPAKGKYYEIAIPE